MNWTPNMSKSKCLVSFSLPHHGEGKPFYPPPTGTHESTKLEIWDTRSPNVKGCWLSRGSKWDSHPASWFCKNCVHAYIDVCARLNSHYIYTYIIYIYITLHPSKESSKNFKNMLGTPGWRQKHQNIPKRCFTFCLLISWWGSKH